MISFQEVTDIKTLSLLAAEIWNESNLSFITKEQIDYMLDKFQSEKAVKEQIIHENYIYFFIICNDKKAGYIGLSNKKDYLFLSKLYIKKEFRHKGLGSKSFEYIKEYAKSLKHKKIRLTVNKNNTNAFSAYKKWGFKVVDEVVTDIGSNYVMDDFIMEYLII